MVVSQVEASSRNNDLQSAVSKINTTLSDKTEFTPEKEKRKREELQKIRENIAIKNNEFEDKTLLDSREYITIGTEKLLMEITKEVLFIGVSLMQRIVSKFT